MKGGNARVNMPLASRNLTTRGTTWGLPLSAAAPSDGASHSSNGNRAWRLGEKGQGWIGGGGGCANHDENGRTSQTGNARATSTSTKPGMRERIPTD